LDEQVIATRKVLGTEWDEVPVRSMLGFVGAEWP